VEGAVYLLCAATALACGVLLLRGYRRSGARLLLWCGLFFLALVVENSILFCDRVVFPEIDLIPTLRAVGLAGIAILVYGLIWDAD
jgi:hypothetical protein